MKHGGWVYIITNKWHTVLYAGITASLSRRIMQHQEKMNPKSFTAKYNCDVLVYYRGYHSIEEAIAEETRIKGLSRKKKIILVTAMNPLCKDMYPNVEE